MSLPLTLPLHGSHLIEASAGTGKTWTIAALYLRLVLGHGRDADPEVEGDTGTRPPRPLMPGEILVMTFTRAATRELSDRIRERLAEAARCFRGEPGSEALLMADPLLRALLDDHPAGEVRDKAAYRLALAAEAMDDAAVHTIDAWSQRMLREHAFDSGNLFDEELVADESALREEAVRDFWRAEVYPLRGADLQAVLDVWSSLPPLQAEVKQLLPRQDLFEAPPVASLRTLFEARAEELRVLRQGWPGRVASMRTWLLGQLGSKGSPFNGNKLRLSTVEEWFDGLQAWAEATGVQPLRFSPEDARDERARTRLTPSGLMDALKAKASVEIPPDFVALEGLLEALDRLGPLEAELRQHAARKVAARMDELKQRVGRYGFSDLQARLAAALGGPRGAALRERILQQYPVALIDEFQDTSPLQYRLFDRLYRIADDVASTGLFLIGDPKQSIYAFRGADIYSYLRARHDTAGRHHKLDTNFRSTQGVVDAVNHLFAQAEARLPGGAFHLAKGGDFALPFDPVKAQGRTERLVSALGEVPALALCTDDTCQPADPLRRRWATLCAERIVDLLNDPDCGLQRPDGGFVRLNPGDIAVLVRSRIEAQAVRRALDRRGVASVYLSDQESVFGGPEAVELLRWLRAVAEPTDTRLARAAHAGAVIGLPLEELRRCSTDDEAWDTHLLRLRELQGVWQRQGVLALLRRTLHELDLPARWLAQPGGERTLTNVLHLSELLQSASAQLEGEHALVRWLAEQIADHAAGVGEGGEDRIVRLESDAALVQVVTVHKSKGLEYPVVFLPFAGLARAVDRRGAVVLEHVDETGARHLDFTRGDAAIDSADTERLREDLRLLYVALTRARHALWVGAGLPAVRGKADGPDAATSLPRSALGHLIGLTGEQATPQAVRDAWAAALSGAASIVTTSPTEERGARLLPRGSLLELLPAPGYTTRIERDWTIGSFSALVRDLSSGPVASPWGGPADAGADHGVPSEGGAPLGTVLTDPLREEAWREEAQVSDSAVVEWAQEAEPWHRYPRGPLAGNFLHEQLERVAVDWSSVHTPEFLAGLKRRCERAGPLYHAEEVRDWLVRIVETPMPGLGVALSACDTRLVEMEFWMPSGGGSVAVFDRVCQGWIVPGRPRPALPERTLRGLMMGFADLVCEHEGRYWVLDYKSNALGADDAAYGLPALEHALLHHRYDVQAALYLLALHRLLRSRLGERYDPQQHLGGALYLFARGVSAPSRGCLHIPADAASLEALDRLLDQTEADTTTGSAP